MCVLCVCVVSVCVTESESHYLSQLCLFTTSSIGTHSVSHSLTFCLSQWCYNSTFKLGAVCCIFPLSMFLIATTALLSVISSTLSISFSIQLSQMLSPLSFTIFLSSPSIFSPSLPHSIFFFFLVSLVSSSKADDSISYFHTAESPELPGGIAVAMIHQWVSRDGDNH